MRTQPATITVSEAPSSNTCHSKTTSTSALQQCLVAQACIGCHLLLAMHPSTLRGQVLHTRTQPAIITATRAPLHQEHHAVKHFAWTLSLLQWFYLLCLPLCIGTQQPTVFILGDTHNRNTRPRSFDWKIESALLPKFRCGTQSTTV